MRELRTSANASRQRCRERVGNASVSWSNMLTAASNLPSWSGAARTWSVTPRFPMFTRPFQGNTIETRPPVESGDIAPKYLHEYSATPQPLPASPACCVVVSDPAAALTPEVSFPKVMLTDRVRREALFSLTQTRLSPVMGLPWPTASSKKNSRGREATIAQAGCVRAGPSLLELVASHEGKALEPPCLPLVNLAQEGTEKVRYKRGHLHVCSTFF